MARFRPGSSLAVLAAVWLGAGRAEAQIRFDKRAMHVEPTLAFAVASGADRYLALQVCLYDGGDRVTSATYAGRSFTFLGAMRAGPNAGRIEHWGLVAPPVGMADVVVQKGSSAFLWGVISYAGVHQSVPTRPFAVGIGTGLDPSFTAASAAGDTVVSSLCLTGASNLMFADDSRGQTPRGVLYSSDYAFGQAEIPGAATITSGWRFTGGGTPRWAIATVSLRPAPATGEGPDAGTDAGAPDLAPQEPQPADLAPPEPPLDDAAVVGADAAPAAGRLDLSIGCACAAAARPRPAGGGLAIVLVLVIGVGAGSSARR